MQVVGTKLSIHEGTWSGAFNAGSKIYSEAGVRGLLQGHSVTLLRVFPYVLIGLSYPSFANTKFQICRCQIHGVRPDPPCEESSLAMLVSTNPRLQFLMPSREAETNARRFTAGALSGRLELSFVNASLRLTRHGLSGMTSVVLTYPLEVLRVRMAFQTGDTKHFSPSLSRAFQQIYRETALKPATSNTGVPASQLFEYFPLFKFYRGFTATMIGMIPYAGVSFLSWGYLRARFIKDKEKGSKTLMADLAIGAVSGALAQTSSYPFEVIRRRMQVGGITNPDKWLRWEDTVRAIWTSKGWRGFYVGLSIGYLKIVPMTAVSYTVWQSVKRLLEV